MSALATTTLATSVQELGKKHPFVPLQLIIDRATAAGAAVTESRAPTPESPADGANKPISRRAATATTAQPQQTANDHASSDNDNDGASTDTSTSAETAAQVEALKV